MNENQCDKWDKYGFVIVLIGLIVIFFLGAKSFGAETYRTDAIYPMAQDSIKALYYKGTTLTSTTTRYDTAFYDTSWSLNVDTLHTIVFKSWSPGLDSAGSWVWYRDLRTSATTGSWPVPAYWQATTDSVRFRLWRNGVQVISRTRTSGQQSYDTIISTISNVNFQAFFDIFASGGQRLFWGFQHYYDTGSYVSAPAPSEANLAYVQGVVRYPNGSRVIGANVVATRNNRDKVGVNSSGTLSVFYLSQSPPVGTDTTGQFRLELMRTTSYADTTAGFYNISIYVGGEKVIEVPKVRVPAEGNVDLGEIYLSKP